MSLYRQFGNHLSPLYASLLIRVLSVWRPCVVLRPLILLSAVQCVVVGKLFCEHRLSSIPYFRVAIVRQRISVCQYSTGMLRVGWYRLQLVRTATVYLSVYCDYRSRDSSGSIVSDYGLDDRATGVRSAAGAKDFSSSLCVQTGSGAHPASCTMGTGGDA
jgi:hypothetical protein